MGDFEKAYKLAHEAYLRDPYNRMAFTIKIQSEIAKEWARYIQESEEYFAKIEQIANKENITPKDKAKIKIMLEILIDEYKTLKPSLLIPEWLKIEAKKRYEKAKRLYEAITTGSY
jgi:hypothetical protein